MTTKGLRRLANDHAHLHKHGLPPNYLWPAGAEDAFSDLSSLTVLLAGATGTPFVSGIFTLTLHIPPTYPQSAPTAFFKTKIFHPNVDPATGAVCVETLKRDWKPELTLRDILITITCLLVFPNPASALNAEAGRLVESDFASYERKARLWTGMHAAIPADLRQAVEKAKRRGEDEVVVAKVQAGPSNEAVDRRKRRERETKVDGGDVFVREDSIQNTPPKQFAQPAAPPLLRGLGIDILPGSSLNAQIETPTQQNAPARRRKKASQHEEGQQMRTSQGAALSTPKPSARPLAHSNPSTPRLGQPEPKRRRLTPPEGTPSVNSTHVGHEVTKDDMPWRNWQSGPPLSPPEPPAKRSERITNENRLLTSLGGNLNLYNAGNFGPRLGVGRL